MERLRIDPAHHVGQWRLNDVTALVVFYGCGRHTDRAAAPIRQG
ncbi:prolipoprotein diacylglyceryl transferase [Cutibacterium acnes JCM 18918]|nr:prolipoprotein diacylglyceryl transferase [Cutibacterium acnes JCM 18918]